MSEAKPVGYEYRDFGASHTQAYLWGPVIDELRDRACKSVFDLGCGNGALAHELAKQGFETTGVDPSETGIRIANSTYPELKLNHGSAYDDLATVYGRYPAVVSLELVEHVF